MSASDWDAPTPATARMDLTGAATAACSTYLLLTYFYFSQSPFYFSKTFSYFPCVSTCM